MTNKPELLPCPFCGGNATVSSFPGAHNVWCENQPVKCGNRSMFTPDQWNNRAQPATAKVVLRAEARECRECNHVGINNESSGSACHSCDWSGGHQAEDKCPGCGDENCMAAACPKCGGRYVLIAEASLNTPQ